MNLDPDDDDTEEEDQDEAANTLKSPTLNIPVLSTSTPDPAIDPSLLDRFKPKLSPNIQSPKPRRKNPQPSHFTTLAPLPRVNTTTTTNRSTTPPLARGDYVDIPFLPPSTLTPTRSAEILSLPQRNLVVMAIQNQINWNQIETETGVEGDKLMRWWLKASSDLVKRG